MINESYLKQFNDIVIKDSLIIEKNSLKYDYSNDLWSKIIDVYNLIKEAIWYVTDKTPSQFIINIEQSIQKLINILAQIKRTENSLWNDFDRQKQSMISSINREIDEIFSFQDQYKLLITLNYLKNDYFAKNTEKISSDMFEKWASWKDEWINNFITMIEEKAKKAWDELLKAEKSTEVIEQVKSWEWFKEFDSNIIVLTNIYEEKVEKSFIFIILISLVLIIFAIWVKCWWFIDFNNFYFVSKKTLYINYPYVIYQALFWILIFSLLSYLLKFSVDQYKIYSNLIINLRSKSSIIKSYLLFLKYWDDKGYAETNKLIIEKTLENLYKDWNWIHFWKDEKIDTKIYDKLLDILPKLK